MKRERTDGDTPSEDDMVPTIGIDDKTNKSSGDVVGIIRWMAARGA